MGLNDFKIEETAATDGISALTDRPNVARKYGGNALTAAQLKERFDFLPVKIIEKFNNLLAYLGGSEFAGEINLGAKSPFETLEKLVESIGSGALANKINARCEETSTDSTDYASLQEIIFAFNKTIAENKETIEAEIKEISDTIKADTIVHIDLFNEKVAQLESTFGDVSSALDEIIALQDYYTGATFDELHEYAMEVAERGSK